MKHLKTFENFEPVNEVFGLGANEKIKKSWDLLSSGKANVAELKSKFVSYGEGFGFDGQNAINYAAKLVPNLYNFLYKNGDYKAVTEEEVAKIYFNRSKKVEKKDGKWADVSNVGSGEKGPGL